MLIGQWAGLVLLMTATLRRTLPELTPHGEALLAQLPDETAALRAAEMRVAHTLAAVAQQEPLRFGTPSAVGELGERHGLSAEQARALRDLGSAVYFAPELEAKVLAGRMPVASAALVGQVFSCPWLLREGDDWIRWAETESTKQLRLRVYERRESYAHNPLPVVPLTAFVTQADDQTIRRAQVIASRKAKRTLTLGQALVCTADHYLDCFDPERRRHAPRRMPDTRLVMAHGAGGKQFRGVPAEVRREVHERQADRCAVAFCDRAIFLEMAHLIWHGKGGHREADNLIVLCTYHHDLFDAGLIKLTGTAERPMFVDEHGRDLMRRIGGVSGEESRTTNGSVLAAGDAAGAPPEPPQALPEPPEAQRKPGEAPERKENGGHELFASGTDPP